MKEKKTIQKSIRMTEKVNEYVLSAPGEGFNEKFENLVIFCFENEQKIAAKIKEANWQLDQLNNQIKDRQSLIAKLQNIEFEINRLIKEVE